MVSLPSQFMPALIGVLAHNSNYLLVLVEIYALRPAEIEPFETTPPISNSDLAPVVRDLRSLLEVPIPGLVEHLDCTAFEA